MRAAAQSVAGAIVKNAQVVCLRCIVDGEFLSIFTFPLSKFKERVSGLPVCSGTVGATTRGASDLEQIPSGFAVRAQQTGSGPARS